MKRNRRGFTLIEVLAAFAIALLLIVPIAGTISGVAGSVAALDRSADRRQELQEAAYAAALVTPLQAGVFDAGGFTVVVDRYGFGQEERLEEAGWALYLLGVYRNGVSAGPPVLQTLRIDRP